LALVTAVLITIIITSSAQNVQLLLISLKTTDPFNSATVHNALLLYLFYFKTAMMVLCHTHFTRLCQEFRNLDISYYWM